MRTAPCPKCGYVRAPRDEAPEWRCPQCGIAYAKYKAYLENAKAFAKPRQREQGLASPGADASLWSLTITNLVVLVLAIVQSWNLSNLMLVYWVQSIVIGGSYYFRIMSLEKFSTKDFKINNRPVAPTEETKNKTAVFFVFHYGFFHFGYLIFITSGVFGTPNFDWLLLLCGAAFVANHMYSFSYHVAIDRAGTPNIGTLMLTPYARILPMHLTILFGAAVGSKEFGLFLFGLLKTGADIVMHQLEHRKLAANTE